MLGGLESGSSSSELLVMALVIVWALSRQFRARVFRWERALITPAVLAVLTLVVWQGVSVSGTELWVTVGTAVFALVAGWVRGRSVRLHQRADGQVMMTGGWGTVIIYVVTLGLHLGADAVLHITNDRVLVATLPLYLVSLMIGRLLALVPRARALSVSPPPRA